MDISRQKPTCSLSYWTHTILIISISLSRAATLHTPVGTMQVLYIVDGSHRRWITCRLWPNHVNHRKSGGHSDLVDPKNPLPTCVMLSTKTLKLPTVLTNAVPITDLLSLVPGVLGHWDSVRGHPGCVCDAQLGLALAAHPLGCPAAPLCCPVFCGYL